MTPDEQEDAARQRYAEAYAYALALGLPVERAESIAELNASALRRALAGGGRMLNSKRRCADA